MPKLDQASEVIATALHIMGLRVRRSPDTASRADMVITRRVPSAVGPPLPWPEIATYRADLWQPKPVGVGEDDQAMTMQLPERNFLLGGEPGAGKSVALSLLVATAALDPNYKLATWNRYAEGSAGVCVSEAIEVLHSLREEMDRRYTQLTTS